MAQEELVLEEGHADHETFSKMRVPHPSLASFVEAAQQFHEELAELRKKHKILNVVNLVCSPYYDDKGKEQFGAVSSSFGDSSMRLPLLAKFYGDERAAEEARLDELASGKKKLSKRKRNK